MYFDVSNAPAIGVPIVTMDESAAISEHKALTYQASDTGNGKAKTHT